MEIKTEEECKIEGMPKIETKRRVTAMDTELSKDPLDENDAGYQKPEPKEESSGQTPNTSKPKEAGKRKERGPKVYNTPDEKKDDEAGGKRRDRDNKHIDDNNHKKQKGDNKTKEDPRSRKDNLRNIINDEEYHPNKRGGMRGNRGDRGGRGGRGRGGRANFQGEQRHFNMDEYHAPAHYRPRDDRDRYQPLPRSNDDFYVRPQRGQERRREHPDVYQHHGLPRYNYGYPP